MPRTRARLDREHPQLLGRSHVVARADRRDRRDRARARAEPPSRRRTARERRDRARRAVGRDRQAVRCGDALPLEGPRCPLGALIAGLGRADGRARGAASTCSAARCGRRGSSLRPASMPSTTTSTGSPTTTHGRVGSPKGGPRQACPSSRRRPRRTSSRSILRRSLFPGARPRRARPLPASASPTPSTRRSCAPSCTWTSRTTTSTARSRPCPGARSGRPCPRLRRSLAELERRVRGEQRAQRLPSIAAAVAARRRARLGDRRRRSRRRLGARRDA